MTCIYFRRAAVVAAIISHTHTHSETQRKKISEKRLEKKPKENVCKY